MKSWNDADLKTLRTNCRRWYQKHSRDLPWRSTHDPYRIWISEIMLQQTQVATVVPYYERFLAEFPTVVDLAKSPIERVLFHWAGLGYYRRARQLHAAAEVVCEKHQGVFPTTFEEVLALPGIGRYTAGAICSFALDQRTPIVEANTQRLFARLLRLKTQLSTSESQNALWSFAELILPPRAGSGEVNQAVMELGSQVCTPRAPSCSDCPLLSLCPTAAYSEQDIIPAPKPAKVYEDRTEVALLVHDPDRGYLMRRCDVGERWAGLWDFPRFDVSDAISQDHVGEASAQFEGRYRSRVAVAQKTLQIKHGVTKYRITLICHEASLLTDKTDESASLEWHSLDGLANLALSSTGKKIAKALQTNASS